VKVPHSHRRRRHKAITPSSSEIIFSPKRLFWQHETSHLTTLKVRQTQINQNPAHKPNPKTNPKNKQKSHDPTQKIFTTHTNSP
jgi:hypothetical protein